MKKLVIALVLSFTTVLSACAQVELWQEGTHYEVIADKASAKPNLTEYFSFWCPACNAYEPLVAEFKKNLPEGVKFKKVHVNFMPQATPDVQELATRAMLIGRAMKEEEKYNGAIFNYIHKQRGKISNFNDLRNIFIVNGADEKQFDKLASSFGMQNLENRNRKAIEDYREHLNSVPTFIVNGKYKVKFTRDMQPKDMIDLINWLTQQS